MTPTTPAVPVRTGAPTTAEPGIPRRAACEFALTGMLLFLVVTGVRWLLAPDSPIAVHDIHGALAILGAAVGVLLMAFMASPPGRRSGGHLNPAVTVALWRLGAFPARAVVPYVMAQLAGSVAGAALGRLVWGPAVSRFPVGYATVRADPSWPAGAVLTAETGVLVLLTMMLSVLLAHPAGRRLLPCAVGLATAVIIATLGPVSGGSANPARQFGPALLAQDLTHLWIYLLGPVLGAVLGAALVAPARSRTAPRPRR
ncbi:aquaporin [Streptomyces sp. NBC_00654]|uniref:MIP/aquaporin family protein n=1 Tax=Streptomyces sp. NBC_00654 TaxID=2975799 RepID=UPI00225A4F28|nr:aquaporin [Streptomyces sp. NBC_00654]MCX4967597.1 aquaporin [Streptomyces sp. NBC_00654]